MRKLSRRNLLALKARWLLFRKAYRTADKIIVIESDDWGSIRTSGKTAYHALKDRGYQLEASPYTLDCLESEEDLQILYDTLLKFSSDKGEKPVFTANIVIGNPNFKAIENSGYKEYSFESVRETVNRYGDGYNIIDKWKSGKNKKVFFPQLHAREHIRFWEWLNDLSKGKEEALFTFKYGMCGLPKKVSKTNTSYFKPLYVSDEILNENGVSLKRIIEDAIKEFEKIFGFKSISTVAPNVAWTQQTENIWKDNGVSVIQGGYLQEIHSKNSINYIARYTGEKNERNQVYLVRNCTFEPSKSGDKDYWKSTFYQIERAFKFNTPAIISTHRVNYVGSICEKNRAFGNLQLTKLLKEVLNKYPNVTFMRSDQLGKRLLKN